MFKQKIQTKIEAMSREKSLIVRLFGVLELLIISLVWALFALFFYLPTKVINYFAARAYAKQVASGKKRKLRYLDLREMKVVKGVVGVKEVNGVKEVKGVKVVESRWHKFVSAMQDELIEISHFHITQKSGKKWAFDIAIVSLILLVIFQFSNFGQAAVYYNTWTSTADFDSNQSTIDKGGQNSDLSLPTIQTNIDTTGGQVQLADNPAMKTENSYSDFSNGTTSNAVLDDNAIKTMPTALADTWNSPGAIGLGGQMIRNGSDDSIYVLQGNNNTGFYKYSISGNSWTTLTVVPGTVGNGCTMTHNGSDDSIYVLQGNNNTGFYKYSISGNSWTTLTVVPGTVLIGGQMIRNGSDNYIYVLRGNSTAGFYRYNILANTWTSGGEAALAQVPAVIYSGGTMIRNGSDNYIYVLQGGLLGFYRYNISANTWTSDGEAALAQVPSTVGVGGTMIRNGSDDNIYVLRGNNSTSFYKYSISSNSWTTLTVVPGAVSTGGTMIRNGSDDNIYVLQGNTNTGFYKYSISGNSWTNISTTQPVPGTVQSGGRMIRNGSDDSIYVLQGNTNTGFYKYSISGNSWTTLVQWSLIPNASAFGVRGGGSLAVIGSDLYVMKGNTKKDIYRYNTSTGWSADLVIPSTSGVDGGGSLAVIGSDLYVMVGNASKELYRYNASTGWSANLAIPSTSGVYSGGSLAVIGSDLYVMVGYSSKEIYRYNASTGWSANLSAGAFASGAGTVSAGGSLAVIGSDLYVMKGSGTKEIYRYNASTGWSANLSAGAFASGAGTVSTGGSLAVIGSDLYVMKGSGSKEIYRYNASTGWSADLAIPSSSNVLLEGSLAVNGNDLYVLIGNSKELYHYNASTGWSSNLAIPSTGNVGDGGSLAVMGSDLYVTMGLSTAEIYKLYVGSSVYSSAGTFTSQIKDLGTGANFSTLSYSATTPGDSSVAVKARSGNLADLSDATAWGSCSVISDGADLSTGGCVNDGDRYVQYQAALNASTDLTQTPTLSGVTLNYAQYTHDSGKIFEAKFNNSTIADYSAGSPYPSVNEKTTFDESGKFNQGVHIDGGTTNLVRNASFEYGLVTPWSKTGNGDQSKITIDSSEHYDGEYSTKLDVATLSNGQYIQVSTSNPNTNYIAVSPNTTYTFSAYAKGGAGNLYVFQFDSSKTVLATIFGQAAGANSNWTRSTRTFTTDANAAYLQLNVRQTRSASPIDPMYFDAIQFEAGSTATPYKGEGADILKYPAAENLNQSEGSIEMWFKPDWAGNDSVTHYLFDSNPQDGTNKNKLTVYKDSTNALFFDIYDNGGTNYKRASIATDATNLTANAWHHLIATYSANQPVNIFLDGVKSTDALTGSGTGTTALPNTFSVGSKWDNTTFTYTNQANASIDNFRIYNRVLSDGEITARVSASAETENIGIVSDLKMHEPADGTAIWSQLDWAESVPNGTDIKFRTRSAGTEDGLTSATWSGYYNTPAGSTITDTPDNPWIEIEASLSTTSGFDTPTLSDFQLTYNVNGPPVVTINSAAQNTDGTNFGKVLIDYDITDIDNTDEQVYLFYEPQLTQLTGAILSTDVPPQTIGVNSTANFPGSGILSIGEETFTYDSKTSTSFNVTARHTTQNEKAQNHSIGDEVFVKATDANVTGLGAKILNAGSPNSLTGQSIVWDVATELPGAYYPAAKIRVMADDNEYVYSTGNGDVALVIDMVSPTVTSLLIDADTAYTHDYIVDLNLEATDGSAVKVKISNNADLSADGLNASSGQWIDYAATISNWNFPQNGDGNYAVYYQFRDIYGNSVTASSDAIIKSSPPAVTINSVTENNNGVVTINYSFTDDIEPPTGQSYFNVYVKYSLDTSANNLQAVTAVTGDVGSSVVATTGTKNITWTPKDEEFSNNIRKEINAHKLRVYVDDVNPAIADNTNIEQSGFGDFANFVLDTQGPVSEAYINDSGDLYTTSSTVSVTFSATDEESKEYQISNYADFNDQSVWTALASSPTTVADYALLGGEGQKYVYIRFRDVYGNIASPADPVFIYKVSPPSVTVNGVAQSQETGSYGKVYIDYTISDAVHSSLDVTMQYYTGSGWVDMTNLTNAGTQTIVPGAATNLIAVWDATAQLAETPLEYDQARLRVYASDGNVVPDQTQYNPLDESGADPNAPDVFILDAKDPAQSGVAISISGTTSEDTIGQPQIDSGISLDLSVTDLSAMYVQFSNDGTNYGTSTNPGGSLKSTSSTVEADDFVSCSFAGDSTGCSWVTYANGNGMSWDPVTGEQGTITVHMRVRDAYGNINSFTDTATVDTVSPTPPNFVVADSSLYGIRYWVTVGWDLFDSTDDPDEYADLTSELSNPNNAYTLERKIKNSIGKLVSEVGAALYPSQDDPDDYFETLVSYPRTTNQDSYIDKDLLAYDEDAPFTYYYRLRSIDPVGNYSTSAWQSITPIGSDTVPPEISSDGPSAEALSTSATISWITDKLSNSIVQFSSSSVYDADAPTVYTYEQGEFSEYNTIHSINIIGLSAQTTYHYRVISTSPFGQVTESSDKTFTTTLPEDSNIDPIIYTPEVQTEGTSADSATIIFKTDKYSYSQILYGTSENNLDLSTVLSTTLNKDHWIKITLLNPGTKYYFKARSVDTYGNEVLGPIQNFTTTNGDAEAAISAVVVSDITMNSAIISWTSDTVTQSEVNYGKSTSYGTLIEDKSSSGTTIHTVKLQNLEQGATYHFRITGTDDTGLTALSSDDYVFDTITLPQIKDVKFSDISENGLTVSWATNVATDSQVEYRLGSGAPRIEAVTDVATVHSVKLQNLDSNSSYALRVIVRDAFGNQVISNPVTVKTNVDSSGPKITQVKAETAASLSQEGKVQAIISWNTDEASTTQVVYSLGSQGNYDKQSSKDENMAVSHLVIVPELVGSSTYHYKVVSIDKAGNKTESNDYTILTPRKKSSLLQIILNNMEQEFGWLKRLGVMQ